MSPQMCRSSCRKAVRWCCRCLWPDGRERRGPWALGDRCGTTSPHSLPSARRARRARRATPSLTRLHHHHHHPNPMHMYGTVACPRQAKERRKKISSKPCRKPRRHGRRSRRLNDRSRQLTQPTPGARAAIRGGHRRRPNLPTPSGRWPAPRSRPTLGASRSSIDPWWGQS